MLYYRRALCDFEKGVIFLQEIYQLWSPTGQRPCFQNNAPVGRHPDHTMAPFAAGVNPVRNSSRCDSKPSGALNPVRDLSLNGINPALRGGTPYGVEPGIIVKSIPAQSSGALFLTG